MVIGEPEPTIVGRTRGPGGAGAGAAADGDPPAAREAGPSELASESATSMTRPVTTPAVAPTAAKPSSFNMLRRPQIVLFCLTWPFLFLRRGYRCFPMRLATAPAPCLTALLHRRVVADQPDHRRAHHHRAFREVAPRPVQVTAPATMMKKNAPGGGKRKALVR
nr:hypothetical protein [Corynebacterium xerosis]